jgi:UDP-N-acetylglucosamine acyltransferase
MMVEGIHPTAIVDPRAELGPGVSVGAYSVIGPEVILGTGCQVGHHVVLESTIHVGERCRIGHGTIIGGAPQDLKFREGTPSGVKIGVETVIREHVTIHRATRENGWTAIGDHCLIMASSHIAHDCQIGNHVIIINYAALTGHVRVDDQATVGGISGIRPFARIGTYAYIGGYSKVNQDVPPFVIVDGVPATARAANVIGLRRGGVGPEDRRLIQTAFRLLYRSGFSPPAAVGRIRAELAPTPFIARLVEFVETSRLGIVGPYRPAAGSEVPEAEEERIF